jgi:hypothetical protein
MSQPEFPARAQVVIIGGGIAGCSIAYHLVRRGIRDVLLLEQNKLTGGTTWHAAGLVTQLKSSHSLTRLATYTTRLIQTLEEETGQATGYRKTGSILVASDHERWEEIMRGLSMARTVDVEMHEISLSEAAEEMGCLAVMPGSHREEGLSLHCPGVLNDAENYIPKAILERHGVPPTPLPVTAGSLILLTRWTEHGALTNESDSLRWSFDLCYQPIGQPTGRPAFPSVVLRSSDLEVATAESYAEAWEDTRQRLLSKSFDRPIYEQARWLDNRDNPVCA